MGTLFVLGLAVVGLAGLFHGASLQSKALVRAANRQNPSETPMRRERARFPGLRMPPGLDEDAIRANCEMLGIPLRRMPNRNLPNREMGGYSWFFLPLADSEDRIQKLVEQPMYHIEEGTQEEDLREFLYYLERSGLVSMWVGIPGEGVHLQLSYEQWEFWFSWFDLNNTTFALQPQREDLPT